MDVERRTYDFDRIKDRVAQIIGEAWRWAETQAPQLAEATLSEVTFLCPPEGPGADVLPWIRKADGTRLLIRFYVNDHGVAWSFQPHALAVGEIFDKSAKAMLGAAIKVNTR